MKFGFSAPSSLDIFRNFSRSWPSAPSLSGWGSRVLQYTTRKLCSRLTKRHWFRPICSIARSPRVIGTAVCWWSCCGTHRIWLPLRSQWCAPCLYRADNTCFDRGSLGNLFHNNLAAPTRYFPASNQCGCILFCAETQLISKFAWKTIAAA